MKLLSLSILCPMLLIFVASIVSMGWFLHSPEMVQLYPGLVGMVFNTAFCFFLLGIYFLSVNFQFSHKSILQKSILLIILILAGLSISQDIFHYDLGVDRLVVSPWLNDPNPTPVRMAPNTSVAFILSAIIGLLLPLGSKKPAAIIIQFFVFCILFIALVGLLIYTLKLEYVFSWYRYTRMAIHTASCFIITSIAWYALCKKTFWFEEFYKDNEDKRIILITGIIIFCITLITALGAIATLTHINVLSIQSVFKSELENKITVFNDAIQNVEKDIFSTVKSPVFFQTFDKKSQNKNINEWMNFLISKGFTTIQLLDSNNFVLQSEGISCKNVSIEVLLQLPYKAYLLWDNGFYFKFIVPITQGKKLRGYLAGEVPLPAVDKMYKNFRALGESGETGVCSYLNKSFAQCFPTRLTPKCVAT